MSSRRGVLLPLVMSPRQVGIVETGTRAVARQDGANGERVYWIQCVLKIQIFSFGEEQGVRRWYFHGTTEWEMALAGPVELVGAELGARRHELWRTLTTLGSEVERAAFQAAENGRQHSSSGSAGPGERGRRSHGG